MSEKLEDLYMFREGTIPLVVLDYRVSLFSLLWGALANEEYVYSDEDVELYWEGLFNFPLLEYPKQNFQIVVVDDIKYKYGNYWRNSYLEKAEGDYPIYKGNRKPHERPQMYHQLYRTGMNYIKRNNIKVFHQRGFEADDFAGAICSMVKQTCGIDRDVLLYTIDSDWGQLVDDFNNILFYYSSRPCWQSKKLRDENIIKEWFLSTQNIKLERVTDIVKIKSEKGDKADNLRPGSPKEVIDLLNPGKTLSKRVHNDIQNIFDNPKNNVYNKKSIIAKNKINQIIMEA